MLIVKCIGIPIEILALDLNIPYVTAKIRPFIKAAVDTYCIVIASRNEFILQANYSNSLQ